MYGTQSLHRVSDTEQQKGEIKDSVLSIDPELLGSLWNVLLALLLSPGQSWAAQRGTFLLPDLIKFNVEVDAFAK